MDKAAGRLGETAGRLTGDESLEAEARAAGKELARGHRLSQLLSTRRTAWRSRSDELTSRPRTFAWAGVLPGSALHLRSSYAECTSSKSRICAMRRMPDT
jgi:hypothetical protein